MNSQRIALKVRLTLFLVSPPVSAKENAAASIYSSSSSLPTTTRERRENAVPLSKSLSISIDSR